MLNHVEYPSSVKEGTETPGAFDQNGQRFYVLDRLQEQASRIRYLLDTAVFFRNQLRHARLPATLKPPKALTCRSRQAGSGSPTA